MKADKILRSKNIFTSMSNETISGFIAISDNKIVAIEEDLSQEKNYSDSNTRLIDLEDKLVCSGFTDAHCFFTGYLLTQTGVDLTDCKSEIEVFDALDTFLSQTDLTTVLARNLNSSITLTEKKLNQHFKQNAVIIFETGHEKCVMTSFAQDLYSFTSETCWSESYWKLLRFILSDKEYVANQFKKYLAMLNAKGITSIKEMGFDDYYGFTDILKELEENDELTMRVHFMSQPVGFEINLKYGIEMRKLFTSEFVRFSGYNQMTDGSISQLEADMKEPYLSEDTSCRKDIDWKSLERDVLTADENDFRFSLHAQGDAAIAKSIDIFNKCKKDKNGKLLNRHAITDLECCDPSDLKLMGEIGVVAEIYPQIMSIACRDEKLSMINELIGEVRGKNYWNRRKMLDNGIVVSCATDLPLLFDDIPESIYHSVGGYFPEGGEAFNKENTMTVSELLKAWTIGGQHNLGFDSILGSLSAGKLADITVFDSNLFDLDIENIREAKVILTIVDGQIVYSN